MSTQQLEHRLPENVKHQDKNFMSFSNELDQREVFSDSPVFGKNYIFLKILVS